MQQLSDSVKQLNETDVGLGLSLPERKILLFDLSVGGHHAAYIQHLICYLVEQNLPGRLDIVVVPKFFSQHQDVVELGQACDRINFVPITDTEVTWLGPWTTYVQRKSRALREWTLLNRYAIALGSTECVLLYFDTFQLSAVLKRKLPCPFSGIYFRPRFHYDEFPGCTLSWKDKVRHWQERFHISQALRHPQLKTLFCLDQFAVKYLKEFHSHAKIVYLPDPVQIYSKSESKVDELKANLGIEANRRVFFLFGVLDGRKGIHQLLDAISTLSPALCEKICLLLVGKIAESDSSTLQNRIREISQALPVQIIVQDKFISEQEVPLYFQSADVVLALYQRHVGMSGIVVQGAAVQKPLLSSDYGLMGETVRHWQLGLTVDSTIPTEIASCLTQFLTESPEISFDPSKAKYFAEQNSAENYASTIFKNM
jgi:glycosyltransferase involved in cell wall biosynthesis